MANGLWTIPIFAHSKGLLHTVLGRLASGRHCHRLLRTSLGRPLPGFNKNQSPPLAALQPSIRRVRSIIYSTTPTRGTNSNSCFQNGCEFGGTNQTYPIVGTNYFDISHSRVLRESAETHSAGLVSSRRTRLYRRISRSRSFTKAPASRFAVWRSTCSISSILLPSRLGALDNYVESPNFGRPTGALAGRSIELQARFTF